MTYEHTHLTTKVVYQVERVVLREKLQILQSENKAKFRGVEKRNLDICAIVKPTLRDSLRDPKMCGPLRLVVFQHRLITVKSALLGSERAVF